MEILVIANSYGIDATRYLHRIARADGVTINTTCLCIGGCPLDRHFRNIHTDNDTYEIFVNGEQGVFRFPLKEALLNRKWDIITIQQASDKSFDYNEYQPYLNELADYIRNICPESKLYIHETWCDAPDSHRLSKFGFSENKEMLEGLKKAYNQAAIDINADGILKSGEAIYSVYEKGITNMWRDIGHLSYGIGRFTAALMWYYTLTGNDLFENNFSDTDEPIIDEQIKIIKECVMNI